MTGITTNANMQKVERVWKCDVCGSTDISDYKGLGKKCNGCGHSEEIDELEARNSKIRVLLIPIKH